MREPDEGIEVGSGTNIFSVYVRINTLNQIKYTPTLMHICERERERAYSCVVILNKVTAFSKGHQNT